MPSQQGSYAQPDASRYVSQAAEETKVVKASPGLLMALVVTNVKASAIFLFVYDHASAPGTLLMAPLAIPSGGTISLPLAFALPFTTGLYLASSSTGGTYTATTTADLMIDADFK